MSKAAGDKTFSPFAVLWMVAVSVVAFIALLLLIAYAPDMERARNGRAHALSVSATGYKGFATLLGDLRGSAEFIRNEADTRRADFLILTPETRTDPADLARVVNARRWGGTLIVLPKWDTSKEGNAGWVKKDGAIATWSLTSLLKDIASVKIDQVEETSASIAAKNDIPAAPLRAPAVQQRISGSGVHAIITDEKGRTVLAKVGTSAVYVLAEPDLVNNQGLKDPQTARAAIAMVAFLTHENVSFDLTLNGFAQKPNLLKLAFQPPFLALTLCIIAAGLLAGFNGAYRFGEPRHEGRAIAFGKRALLDNTAQLIRAAKREHRLGGRYAALTRDAVASAVGAPGMLSGAALVQFLDRLGGRAKPGYAELAQRAELAGTRADMLAIAQALYHWRKDKTRDRR